MRTIAHSGGSVTYTITKEAGYEIDRVLVNGVDKKASPQTAGKNATTATATQRPATAANVRPANATAQRTTARLNIKSKIIKRTCLAYKV